MATFKAATTSGTSVYADIAYAPYGESYAPSGASDLSFTGQNNDTISDLYDFTFREYHAGQGRWIAPDPAGLAAVNPMNPQTWNRYAYVGGNPLSNVDPVGLCTPNQGCDPHYEVGDAVSAEGDNCVLTFSCTVYTDSFGMQIDSNVALTELHNGSGVICPECFGRPERTVDGANQIWGWKLPNGDVAPPNCGLLGCYTPVPSGSATPGGITLLAYWGVIGKANDPGSFICIFFCGADGSSVFDRNYSTAGARVSAGNPVQAGRNISTGACMTGELINNFVGDPDRAGVSVAVNIPPFLAKQAAGSLLPGPGWVHTGVAVLYDSVQVAKSYLACE